MAQKVGNCELCGGLNLVADYGPNGEYVCVDCAVTQFHFDSMLAEMERRLGKEQVKVLVEDVLRDKTKH